TRIYTHPGSVTTVSLLHGPARDFIAMTPCLVSCIPMRGLGIGHPNARCSIPTAMCRKIESVECRPQRGLAIDVRSIVLHFAIIPSPEHISWKCIRPYHLARLCGA